MITLQIKRMMEKTMGARDGVAYSPHSTYFGMARERKKITMLSIQKITEEMKSDFALRVCSEFMMYIPYDLFTWEGAFLPLPD
jgi:hypothetical protein